MKTVTMKDIARQIGISRQAVSQILNNTKESRISDATREKVMQAVRELNYRPNLFARTLKTRKTNCIGILRSYQMRNAADFYYPAIADGVEHWLADHVSPYTSMMFGSNSASTYNKTLALIEANMVDGLIIVALSYHLAELQKTLFPRLNELSIPFVVIHTTAQDLPYHNVGVDIQKTGQLAAEYLVKQEYAEPGFYLARPDSVKALDLLNAYKVQLIKAGGKWMPENLITGDFKPGMDSDILKVAVDTFKTRENLPKAILVPWSRAAWSVMDALRERGVRVPEDVAILTTEDDIPDVYENKELSTINYPLNKKGFEGMRILMGLLDGTLDPDTIHTYTVEPELITRTSCGE